jgi:hypothetical protein
MSELLAIVTTDMQAAWDYAQDAALGSFVICAKPADVPARLGGAAFLTEVSADLTRAVAAALAAGDRSA